MDEREMEGRLAAHAVEPETAEPDEPAQESEATEPDEPPEALVKTVGDVIRFAGGHDSRVVVELLKKVGALEERPGERCTELVYTFYKPLCRPFAGVDAHRGVRKLAFATELSGHHKRRMAKFTDGPENAVLLTWVEALTGKPRDLIDRLSWIDAEACIAIAHYIEGQAGNE